MNEQPRATQRIHGIAARIALILLASGSYLAGASCSSDPAPIEVCPIELTTCEQDGLNVCTDTGYDPEHCGVCGNVCSPAPQAVATCVQSQCRDTCQDGYGDCNFDIETDGCETDLSSTSAHCGGCGIQCLSTELCENSACVEDPAQSALVYLQITSLDTSGCSAVEHFAVSGQDRGGLAVSQDYFYYMGSLSGARFALANPADNPTQVPLRYSIFSDLATSQVYAFTVGGTAAAPDCDEVIDGFIELDAADLSPIGEVIPLSTPITWLCDDDNGGVFSGRGQVLLHDSAGRTYAITLPTGEVSDLGTQALLDNARGCANWAISGIAESFGGDTYMVYRSDNPQAIVRHSVTTGEVATILDLTGINVQNLCALGADLTGNRWAWHYQGAADLDPFATGFQVAGTCPATYETAPAP